ncbi:alginate export family protein [Neptunicella sp.]|uniref:alginate export family protein n=1 Tax=Neptunicella sp. TaxID=2125986 RepID=UPI003F692F58
MKKLLTLCMGSLLSVAPAMANNSLLDDIKQAASDSKIDLNLRYRYEWVDQDGIDEGAGASTLRTRLTYQAGSFRGFKVKLEADDVSNIGNDLYNSTVNGKSQYPVVADPVGTELNQAFISYATNNLIFSVGRQRINHNDQRFVGGVGWRQNEQTFDGYRVEYHSGKINADYAYVYNVNRIFGPNSQDGDLPGSLHLLNTSVQFDEKHRLTGYIYDLDFDTAAAASSLTLGVTYDGNVRGVTLRASYAQQYDSGDNPVNYSTSYYSLDTSTKLGLITFGAGYESLGSDNGKGFATPLATLHKFQGFTDKFLATPANGVNDLYFKVSGKMNKFGLTVIWHNLEAETGSADYGTEIDLVASYPLADKIDLLVKYANYSADEHAGDTSKLWTMLTFSF